MRLASICCLVLMMLCIGCSKDSKAIKAVQEGNKDQVEQLIRHGANINAKDEFDYTLLHLAVNRGNLEITQLLVENNAEINAQDRKMFWTPLDIAEKDKHDEIVKYLISKGAKKSKELE